MIFAPDKLLQGLNGNTDFFILKS